MRKKHPYACGKCGHAFFSDRKTAKFCSISCSSSLIRPKKRYADAIQPIGSAYRIIPLTRNQSAIVDVRDFEWLSKQNWCAEWNPRTKSFYAANDKERMHRLILGCGSGEIGDHVNGDTLDNRRSNLRKATPAENSRNSRMAASNKSGFKGVYRDNGKWAAGIVANGEGIYLGLHSTREEAARAYDTAARRYHGEFARLNFPAAK